MVHGTQKAVANFDHIKHKILMIFLQSFHYLQPIIITLELPASQTGIGKKKSQHVPHVRMHTQGRYKHSQPKEIGIFRRSEAT